MNLRDVEWLSLDLDANVNRSDIEKRLRGLISAGRPFVADALELAEAANKSPDPEILIQSQSHDFFYLKFPLNIRPGEDHDIRFISLDIELVSEGNDAVSWSLDPIRVDQELKVTTEAGFTTKLKLQLFEIGTDDSSTEEYIHYQPTIEAFGLGECSPAWEIRAVEGKRLSGILLFHLVVQTAKDKLCSAQLRMRADVYKRGFIWPYRVIKPDESDLIFEIPLNA